MPTFPERLSAARSPTRSRTAAGRGLLGNKTASGTAIIDELGPRHLATGELILYTSADSVLQIAAHEEIVPLPELYRICEAARAIADRHRIGRVIARPFVGTPGAFRRTYNRRDYSLVPPGADAARPPRRRRPAGGRRRQDLRHLRRPRARPLAPQRGQRRRPAPDAGGAARRWTRGLLFVNLVDFDMLYGHRNDVPGFARALGELDAWLPALRDGAARPATSPSSPPITATIRPRPAPTTRASASRCSPSAPACARRRWARGRRSAISARRSPPRSASRRSPRGRASWTRSPR